MWFAASPISEIARSRPLRRSSGDATVSATMAIASRENGSMSKRYPASCVSGCIKHLACPHNLVPSKRVFQRRLLHQIHFPAKQRRQLVLAMHQIPQIPRIVRLEDHEQIDVAVVVEIVAQDRPEERQLRDPPRSEEHTSE